MQPETVQEASIGGEISAVRLLQDTVRSIPLPLTRQKRAGPKTKGWNW